MLILLLIVVLGYLSCTNFYDNYGYYSNFYNILNIYTPVNQ